MPLKINDLWQFIGLISIINKSVKEEATNVINILISIDYRNHQKSFTELEYFF